MDQIDRRLSPTHILATFVGAVVLLGIVAGAYSKSPGYVHHVSGGALVIGAAFIIGAYFYYRFCVWQAIRRAAKAGVEPPSDPLTDAQGKWYAEFGRALWAFTGLWYVVFLVGASVAAMSVLLELLERPSGASAIPLYLKGARDVLLAAFMAVVTNVLAHAFDGLREDAGGIKELTDKLGKLEEETEGKSQQIIEKYETTLGRIDQATDQISGAVRLSSATIRNMRAARQMEELALAIHGTTGHGELKHSILEMNRQILAFNERSLDSLIAPAHRATATQDPILDHVVSDIASGSQNNLPHYAYMSAATSRYFELESQEHSFHGVMINVTSFSYYVKTVEEIVQALTEWHSEFQFYTLMPECPLDLFRFSNSTEFEDWRGFLRFYHQFITRDDRVWKRYFLYTPSEIVGVKSTNDIVKSLDFGYVLTPTDSGDQDRAYDWEPSRVTEDQINHYLSAAQNTTLDNTERDTAIAHNKPHGGVGTVTSVFEESQLNADNFSKLKDVLLGFHGENPANFCYRCIDDLLSLMSKKYTIVGEHSVGDRPTLKRRHCTISIPKDIFAIRKGTAEDGEWVFLMGRDEDTVAGSSKSPGRFALAPVLDLQTMAADGSPNRDAAHDIRSTLDKIFLEVDQGCDPDNCLAHDAFKEKYGPAD